MKKNFHIVLDTSIFVNPDSRFLFGKTPKEALNNFLDSLVDKKHVSCYMPPSIYEELMKFIEKKPPAKKMLLLNKKPPSSYQASVPAIMVYEFIEEMRIRVNKGLRIAEKYSKKAAKANEDSSDEALVKSLRQEYRSALREGILDSRQDFDLILVAKELNAYLATTDGGLIKWAKKLGITCLSSEELKEIVS